MITARELYALMPLAILGLGSVAVLLAGAFAPRIGRVGLVYAAAVLALLSALSAAFCGHDVHDVAGMVGTGSYERLFGVITGVSVLFSLLFSAGYVRRKPLGAEEYPALMLFAGFGMYLLGSSVSLIGVFLGLECMSLALYVLLASNRAEPSSGESGMKYLVTGAVSTAFFAFGMALVYFGTGSLNISKAMKLIALTEGFGPIGLAGLGFLIVGFGFKASLFPFHLWAPDVYEGGPAPVVAFLSTGSKAAVFVALTRFFGAYYVGDAGAVVHVLWVMAAGTMVFGNIAALTQDNVKRLLAYSSIAQMGYILLAMMASPGTGSQAMIFYIIVYVAMDLMVFGVVASLTGKGRDFTSIDALRGMGFTHPYRCGLFTVGLLSLAGMPPTAGFIGKFYVFLAGMKAGYTWLVMLAVLMAIVSVYYYLRLIVYMYMRPEEDGQAGETVPMTDPPALAALAVLGVFILLLGILPGRLLLLLDEIAF